MSGVSEEEWQNMSPEERLEFQIKNCIFCKIIKGEIPSKKVYENDNFLGILDINPGTKGHVLVLPKKHVQIMPQLGAELCGELGVVAKTISEKLKKALDVKATSVFIANGAVAGQNAPHFMTHIIPRKNDDNIKLNPELKKIDINTINTHRKKFINALGLPDPAEEKQKEQTPPKEDEQTQIEPAKENKEEKPNKDLLDKISKMFD